MTRTISHTLQIIWKKKGENREKSKERFKNVSVKQCSENSENKFKEKGKVSTSAYSELVERIRWMNEELVEWMSFPWELYADEKKFRRNLERATVKQDLNFHFIRDISLVGDKTKLKKFSYDKYFLRKNFF